MHRIINGKVIVVLCWLADKSGISCEGSHWHERVIHFLLAFVAINLTIQHFHLLLAPLNHLLLVHAPKDLLLVLLEEHDALGGGLLLLFALGGCELLN